MAQVFSVFSFCNLIERGHDSHRGCHNCTTIDFVMGGRGFVVKDSGRTTFGASSVIVHQANDVYKIEQHQTGTHVCVGIHGCNAERITAGVYPSEPSLHYIAEELRKLITAGDPANHMNIELFVGLAALTLAKANCAKSPVSIASRAHAIIDSEYHAPLTIAAIASRLHVSTGHLRDRFRMEYGEAPTRYLLRRRMAAAQDYLNTSVIPVQEIAFLCGIKDALYFSRQFHRVTGYSPTRWRKANQDASQARTQLS